MLEVCDSLRLKKLPDVAADQLIHVYAHLYAQKDELPFTILPTQRQTGLNSGLHAIKSATQICCGEDPTDYQFDHDKVKKPSNRLPRGWENDSLPENPATWQKS